jgi:RsiW-degrading membrane proteinase PrsW (M82 family)
MSTIQVTFDGRNYTFSPGATIRIGRSSDNDVVVNDPTVSRRHAQLSWEAAGWVWQNAGQSPTFLAGQPVAQFAVGQQVDIRLASPQGPALTLTTDAGHGRPGPGGTELAAGVGTEGRLAGHTNVAGQAPGGQAAGHGAAAPAAAAAAGAPAGFGAPGQAPPPHGYPGGAPPGMPGYPGYQPGPGYQADPGYQAAGYPAAGYQAGAGYQAAGYPGAGGPAIPAQAGIPLSQLDMGSFFEILIPVKSWLGDRGWRQGIRLLIIPYALLPLIFLGLFANSSDLATPGWAYSLYIAPLWLLTFWYLIRPPVIGKVEAAIAVFVIAWTVIWLHVVTIYVNDHFANTHNILGSLVVGYNEETTKAIPVLIAAIFLLQVRKQKLDPRTWFLMGTVAGLTFGVVEQSIYTPAAIVGIHSAQVAQQAVGDTLLFAFRVFVDGFQHAVWAGVSGFFVGMAVNYKRRRIPLLILGISIPAILHALNDYSLTVFHTVWVGVLVQGVSLLLFLGYTLSASSIERRVRRNPNFRGQSIMMERFSQPEQAPSP